MKARKGNRDRGADVSEKMLEAIICKHLGLEPSNDKVLLGKIL